MEIRKMDFNKYLYQARNLRSLSKSAKVLTGVAVAKQMGLLSVYGRLSAKICRRVGDSPWNGGRMEDLGLLGMRVVTDAGVAFLVDDWDGDTTDITTMNYHDSGTGGTAENQTDTTLVTQAGPTTRATGTKSQPSANVLQSVGTIAYTGTLGITEHGLFSQAAQGGVLWDRTLFTVINVVSGDSIEFTYQCTLTAGS
jgi:hypothetical protein